MNRREFLVREPKSQLARNKLGLVTAHHLTTIYCFKSCVSAGGANPLQVLNERATPRFVALKVKIKALIHATQALAVLIPSNRDPAAIVR